MLPIAVANLVEAGVPRGVPGAVLAAFLTGAATLSLAALHRRVRGTTLSGPWLWSLAAVLGMGVLEILFQVSPAGDGALGDSVRFLAAALSLCPTVAVLGAKRPQDRAWNFVVLVLWAVVSLPSLFSLLLGRQSAFQLADLRGLVLWVLIALPAINYLPTAFAWSGVLVVIGQVIHFAPHLAFVGRPILTTDPGLVTLACFAASAWLAWQTARAPAAREPPLDALWFAFRDSFGLFWGLRVQERVNAAARQYGWPFYLSWSGFRRLSDHAPLDTIPPEERRALSQVLRGLVRRFASPSWIAARSPGGVD